MKHLIQLEKPAREEILVGLDVKGPFDYANRPPGVVGVSNVSNLVGEGTALDAFLAPVSNATSNPTALTTALPQYAVGFQQRANIRDFLDVVAPLLPAGDSFQYKKFTASANFAPPTNSEHKRAIGARKFHEIKRAATLASGSVENKGLTIFADKRLGGLNPAMQQNYVRMLQGLLLLADANEWFALADTNATDETSVNWGATNTSALPDDDLLGLVDASGDALGGPPNLVAFAGSTSIWRKRAINRRKAAGAMIDYLNDNDLADYLEVDMVTRSTARYQSSASAKSKVGVNQVYSFMREPAPTLEDASSFKRPYDPQFGADFTVFIETMATGALITVQHSNVILCPNTVGLRSQPVTFT